MLCQSTAQQKCVIIADNHGVNKTKAMTHNSILISKDGKLLAMNKPEKPTRMPLNSCGDCPCVGVCIVLEGGYNKALQSSISAAEKEQVEFTNDAAIALLTKYIIHERGKSSHPIPILLKDCIGKVYPCPSGWEIRVEEENEFYGKESHAVGAKPPIKGGLFMSQASTTNELSSLTNPLFYGKT